eukprot:Tbor_TRINITY_DN5899_c3_g2::TRINITY_DN5899_c3_g2_i1::g.6563::m.6563
MMQPSMQAGGGMMFAANRTFQDDIPQFDDSAPLDSIAYVNRRFQLHHQSMPDMVRLLREMQSSLEKARVEYNKALTERDDAHCKVLIAEGRLGEVQRVVQRYAFVHNPVVASDGFTYEKNVIQTYLEECTASDTSAYSQQTKEELTNTLVENESLKKLVDMLKSVKATEVAPITSNAKPIESVKGSAVTTGGKKSTGGTDAVNFLEEDNHGDASQYGKKGTNTNKSESESTAKAPEKEQSSKAVSRKMTANGEKEEKEAPATDDRQGGGKNSNLTGKAGNTHPCNRVYGFCNFKDDCMFAKYPYDACLNFIKGKCRFGVSCKELHVNLKDGKYNNPRSSTQQQQQQSGGSPPSGNTSFGNKSSKKK